MTYYAGFSPCAANGANPHRLLAPSRSCIEAMLFEERERARVTLDSIGDAVISTDVGGRITYMNVVAEQMTGWLFEDARAKPFTSVFRVLDASTREAVGNPAQRAIEEDCIVALSANTLLIDREGEEVAIEDTAAPIHDRQGRVSGAVIVFHDVKFSQDVTDRMAYLARHDALTGLPNRNALSESFDHATALANRHGHKVALLFVDLDNFKEVNDTLGHQAGDELLVKLARILSGCVRKTDTVCRYGGDEFVVLLSDLQRLGHPERMARKLRRAISEQGLLEGYAASLKLSIGISVFPDDGLSMNTLLRRADEAMYACKAFSHQEGPAAPRTSGRPSRIMG